MSLDGKRCGDVVHNLSVTKRFEILWSETVRMSTMECYSLPQLIEILQTNDSVMRVTTFTMIDV